MWLVSGGVPTDQACIMLGQSSKYIFGEVSDDDLADLFSEEGTKIKML
jgi:hypothetical protein